MSGGNSQDPSPTCNKARTAKYETSPEYRSKSPSSSRKALFPLLGMNGGKSEETRLPIWCNDHHSGISSFSKPLLRNSAHPGTNPRDHARERRHASPGTSRGHRPGARPPGLSTPRDTGTTVGTQGPSRGYLVPGLCTLRSQREPAHPHHRTSHSAPRAPHGGQPC